jgi:hypothetical protein
MRVAGGEGSHSALDHPTGFCYKTVRAMVASHFTESMIESFDIPTATSARAVRGVFFYATYRAWRFS